MSLLKIEDATFENVGGKVVAKEITMVKYPKQKETDETPTMKIKPLVGDDFNEFIKLSNESADVEESKQKETEDKLINILLEHIEEPRFDLESFKLIKPLILKSIISTVLLASGLPLEQLTLFEKNEK